MSETIPEKSVLIVGGGPIGLMTAAVLAFYGVKSVILERNMEPTKWPKMDLTNVRSMELLRKIGLADGVREKGVPSEFSYIVSISTGLSQPNPVAQWKHPSVDEYKKIIENTNDGSQPLEPYQRISQKIFETWMRDFCNDNPMIDLRYGSKLESIQETPAGVEARVIHQADGKEVIYHSKYAIACDGASSKCRSCLGIPMEGDPIPSSFLLIHFRSNDLTKLHKQGRFWHLFMLKERQFGGAVISQDEKEIFTVHFPFQPDLGEPTISSEEAIYTVLGGLYEPYKIKIDEILVRSTFRPSITIAKNLAGPNLRLFFAGDSAHTNIPTGGYGMNTGIGDAFDVAWKLAAVINGHGGKGLLQSYEDERKPIATQNVKRSGVHMGVHLAAVELMGENPADVDADSETGIKIRNSIRNHYEKNDGENTDLGIEMGYRYKSRICMLDESESEPKWDPHTYLPTTWPGGRAPHVFLKDKTPLFDRLGRGFSLVEFAKRDAAGKGSMLILEAASVLGLPLTYVPLKDEDHAASVWEKPLVLIRPDGHVAWRGEGVEHRSEAYRIVETTFGHHPY